MAWTPVIPVGMMPKTRKKGLHGKATKKQIVYAAARKHKVPGWLLWGIFGAESTWGTNGTNYFGLIEPVYTMYNGTKRSPKNTANLTESADIAAELLYSLKQEHGSWAGAVAQYAPYDISHPRELSRQGDSEAKETVLVDAPFHLPLPGPLDPGNIWEEAEGLGSGIGGLFGLGGGDLPGKAGEVQDAVGTIGDVGAFFAHASKLLFTPAGWLQIGEISGGVILIGWGLHRIINSATGVNPTHTVTKTATKAAEVAAIVK